MGASAVRSHRILPRMRVPAGLLQSLDSKDLWFRPDVILFKASPTAFLRASASAFTAASKRNGQPAARESQWRSAFLS